MLISLDYEKGRSIFMYVQLVPAKLWFIYKKNIKRTLVEVSG